MNVFGPVRAIDSAAAVGNGAMRLISSADRTSCPDSGTPPDQAAELVMPRSIRIVRGRRG